MQVSLTRKQLVAMGLSEYMSMKLTKNLQPIGRKGRAYLYSLHELRFNLYIPATKAAKAKLAVVEAKLTEIWNQAIESQLIQANAARQAADNLVNKLQGKPPANNLIYANFVSP
jgi:signal recognition particle GTPase